MFINNNNIITVPCKNRRSEITIKTLNEAEIKSTLTDPGTLNAFTEKYEIIVISLCPRIGCDGFQTYTRSPNFAQQIFTQFDGKKSIDSPDALKKILDLKECNFFMVRLLDITTEDLRVFFNALELSEPILKSMLVLFGKPINCIIGLVAKMMLFTKLKSR